MQNAFAKRVLGHFASSVAPATHRAEMSVFPAIFTVASYVFEEAR